MLLVLYCRKLLSDSRCGQAALLVGPTHRPSPRTARTSSVGQALFRSRDMD